jgi:DNA-binding CsgD family transcriptional regulator
VLGRWSASQLGARPAAILDLHRAFLMAVLGRLDEARAIAAAGTVTARGEADALLLIKWAEFEGMLRLAAGELAGPPTPPAAAGAVTGAGPGGPPEETFSAVARMTASCLTGLHAGDAAALRAGRAAARKVGAGSSTAVRRLARRLLALTSSGPRAAADSARLLADDPLVPVTALVPCDHGYQPWTARLARTAGHHELAERAVAATAAVDARTPRIPVLAGLAVPTRGVVADDPDLLLDAARVLAGTRRRLLAAAAAEDAGLALAGRQYGDDAATWLENALQLYRDAGALADARRVGRLLRRHGGPRRAGAERPGTGWASLTSSELQVVRMIGRGATNRAAAQELYLSPHTVSSHVRSAFAKLGIHSRVQLAHVLQEFEP